MANAQLRKSPSERSKVRAALQSARVYPMPRRYRRASDEVEEAWDGMRWALAGKRTFDVLATLFLMALLSPVFLTLMLWIPLDSRGPIFYSDRRVGLHGRLFRLYKFRTMTRDAHLHRVRMINENVSRKMLFKHKRDPRVTRLGRILRKFSLDEIPQLFNVLKGDMSLVGPRPYLREDFESDDEELAVYGRWARDRHRLWPGLTGLWQVSGRNDLSFEQSMLLDLHYVAHWSLGQDIKILWRTLPAVFACRGAY